MANLKDTTILGDLFVTGKFNFSHNNMSGDLVDNISLSGYDIDWNAALIYTQTITGATTYSFSNLYVGVKLLEITGDYAVTLPTGFTYAGGTRSATSVTLIQTICTDPSTPAGWYLLLKDES